MATRRFIAGTGVWNLAANWDDGAGGGGAVPLVTDDVLFDVGSPVCDINAVAVAKTINFTGYLAAITFSNNLAVSGNVTFDDSATYVAGGGSLIIAAAATITSDGVSLAVPLDLGGGGGTFAIALADNWTTTGGVSITGSSSASRTLSGSNLYVSGNLTISGIVGGAVGGSADIIINGSSTISSSIAGIGAFAGTLIINGAGADVVFSGVFNFGGSAASSLLTYTAAASVTTTGSTLSIVGTATLATSGMDGVGAIDKWNNVIIGVAGATGFTTTLNSALNVGGDFTIRGATNAAHIINGAFNLNVSGSFTISGITTGSVSGTATIVLNGTGTVTINNSGGFYLPLRIEAGAGVITFLSGTTSVFVGNTFTWVSGTVITTGHTLSLGYDNQTINSGDVHWNNVRIENVTKTLIITGTLFVDGILTLYTNTITRTISTGTISVSGCVTLPNLTTGIITGTGTLNMTGGTLSMNAGATTGYLGLNTTIAGNVTFSGTINVGGGNDATGKGLTYASGTPVVTGSNFKVVNGAYTITCNAAGMVFGTLTLNAPTTFAGSYGFTCTEMISSIAEGAATAGDIVSGWDFTSGWTPFNVTSLTQNSFVSTGSPGGVYKSVLTLGRRYRLVVTGTISIGDFSIQSLSSAENYTGFLTGAFSKTVDIVCSTNTYIAIRAESSGATITITSFTIYEIPVHTFQSTEEYIVTDSLKLQGVSAAQPVVLQASTPATPAFIRCAVPVASQLVNNVDLTSYPAGVLTNQAIDASHGRKIYNANGVLGTLSKNFTLNSLWEIG